MEEEPDKAKLRVIDEGETEEVLRLGDEGNRPEVVERVLVQPKPESAERLEKLEDEDEEDGRPSIEPDIDSIIDKDKEVGDEEWISEESKPVPYAWFLMIFLGIAGLIATSLVMLQRSKGGAAEVARQAAVETLDIEEQEDLEATALVESVEESLRKYLCAKSVDDLMPVVRDPERVKPLMEDWYERNPIVEREFDSLGVFQPLDLEGRLFWLITCLVKGEPGETILMEQTEDGRMLVDWETQVCYQPMSWDDYVEKRPEGESMDFRVYLKPDPGGFYSHEFSDEDEWSVYRLMVKGSSDFLFGYARRGSEVGKRLDTLIEKNRGYPAAMYLRLKIPEGTISPRGVLISEILGERWALVEPLTGG